MIELIIKHLLAIDSTTHSIHWACILPVFIQFPWQQEQMNTVGISRILRILRVMAGNNHNCQINETPLFLHNN